MRLEESRSCSVGPAQWINPCVHNGPRGHKHRVKGTGYTHVETVHLQAYREAGKLLLIEL
jgi:hypothetical protein